MLASNDRHRLYASFTTALEARSRSELALAALRRWLLLLQLLHAVHVLHRIACFFFMGIVGMIHQFGNRTNLAQRTHLSTSLASTFPFLFADKFLLYRCLCVYLFIFGTVGGVVYENMECIDEGVLMK